VIELGVNIDHVATLRQVRGTTYPDPVRAALLAERAGADAITLHLREDRRHIQDRDVETLRARLSKRMNLESAVTREMLQIAVRVRPHDVCLVPERRMELTTEGGLDVVSQFERVRQACELIHRAGGVPVMAHPGFNPAAETLIRDLAGERLLDGVECYYAEHTPEQTARFVGLCRELGLVTTGGSDFHGPAVRAATLGHPAVPWAAWEDLRRRAGR